MFFDLVPVIQLIVLTKLFNPNFNNCTYSAISWENLEQKLAAKCCVTCFLNLDLTCFFVEILVLFGKHFSGLNGCIFSCCCYQILQDIIHTLGNGKIRYALFIWQRKLTCYCKNQGMKAFFWRETSNLCENLICLFDSLA